MVALGFVLLDWQWFSLQGNGFSDAFFAHPYFSLEEIRVDGGGKVGGNEILELTGLRQGISIWKIDPRAIEERVARHSWVRRVRVRREFPRKIVVRIEEWVPQGIVVVQGLHYVNPEGFIFKEITAQEKVDLPFITGLTQASALSLDSPDRSRIAEALTLIRLMGRDSVSEVRFDPFGGVVVYPVSYPVPFHMGWGGWPGKVRRLKRVMAEWNGREHELAALDLNFRDRVVARVKKGV